MPDHVDLGLSTNPLIRPDDDQKELFHITATSSQAETVSLIASNSALRSLWSHLTKILYPRAADQLTERVSTVTRRKDAAPGVTYIITADQDQDTPDIIVVNGLHPKGSWSMRLDRETGDDLWVRLEDLLDQV